MSARIPHDIKRGRLSKAELEQITELGEAGWRSGRIAVKMHRHPATVTYAMHRLGLRELTHRDFAYQRNGVLVKSFSREEDDYLTALRVEGLSVCKIAPLVTARFGHRRSAHTINVRLVLLSNAEAA